MSHQSRYPGFKMKIQISYKYGIRYFPAQPGIVIVLSPESINMSDRHGTVITLHSLVLSSLRCTNLCMNAPECLAPAPAHDRRTLQRHGAKVGAGAPTSLIIYTHS